MIPLSTETFVNHPPPQTNPTDRRYDAYSGRATDSYSGRPHRPSQFDTQRGSVSNATQLPSRNRPTVVQSQGFARPASPQKGSQSSRDKDYFVTPASSKEPRKVEHKKVYSVNEGSANLVADVNVPAGGERHHKRRESDTTERGGYRGSAPEKERGRRSYHLNGPARPSEKSIEDDDAFSYTDPAGMYRDTEPRWREREVRPRRGSVDRGGASRERPQNMLDPAIDPRRSSKEIGPPPSTRGWDKLNDGLGRSRSVRDGRDVPQSPTRAKVPHSANRARVPTSPTRGAYPEAGSYGDQYYVAPRTTSVDDSRQPVAYQDRAPAPERRYEYEDRREPRRHERRNSMTRAPDHMVSHRGFGIRSDSQDRYARSAGRSDSQDRYARGAGRSDSQDRYGRVAGRSDSQDRYGKGAARSESQDRYGRGSDESFDRQNKYRDSGYAVAEPHRRDTAPELNYHEEQRLEQEKKDRTAAERLQNEERERQLEREAREKEQRRREEEQRAYNREYDREREPRRERERDLDVDRERERERERMMQPQHEPERHHHRHDSNRDRDYNRKENGPRESGESLPQSGVSSAAAGGIAGAAAASATAYGLSKASGRTEDRDKDRERGRDLEQDRRYEQPREYERERISPRPQELRPHDARPQDTHSDDGLQYHQERDHQRTGDQDRGLGFAFETPPEPSRSAPPVRDRPEPNVNRERVAEREYERPYEDRPPAEIQQQVPDPDEDYRRRMEQVQRELGRAPEERSSDSDPDRERRRRERELRQRDRVDFRNGDTSTVGSSTVTDATAPYQMPGAYENDSVDGTNSTASRPGLHRKPSILDQPLMMDEPAQIIDNSMSERRENRVRIVDPPTEEEDRKPRGILKKPTAKFPEHPNEVREGVAPLKEVRFVGKEHIGRDNTNMAQAKSSSGIPPGARWTKIDRRLVNPEALEDAKERFEERLDCVIVLRVLTKEEIQKLADRTRELRGKHRSHYTILHSRNGLVDSNHSSARDSTCKVPLPDLRRVISDPAAQPATIDKRGKQRCKERSKVKLKHGAWTFRATTLVFLNMH